MNNTSQLLRAVALTALLLEDW